MTVSVEYALSHLNDLLTQAEAGQEVVIAGDAMVRVRLVPEPAVTQPAAKAPRQLGTMRHTLLLPDNWEEEWERMGEEHPEIMQNGPVFPPFPEER